MDRYGNGKVMLIGPAGKNTSLLVEFAKVRPFASGVGFAAHQRPGRSGPRDAREARMRSGDDRPAGIRPVGRG